MPNSSTLIIIEQLDFQALLATHARDDIHKVFIFIFFNKYSVARNV